MLFMVNDTDNCLLPNMVIDLKRMIVGLLTNLNTRLKIDLVSIRVNILFGMFKFIIVAPLYVFLLTNIIISTL